MAAKWRWLLVALAAVTVGCLVPGSMVTQTLSGSRTARIEAAIPAPSGSECAAVACNRGSTSAPLPLPGVAVAGMLGAGALFFLVMQMVRRARRIVEALREGNPLRLLHPPQLSFSL
jgi:hypothetical protein